MHERLAELLPEARIGVAHGQLRERELEQVMRDFLQQRFNVLLCSTIIETGIDIPNANTIIINRADKFGLAQLHHQAGAVGCSHHQAYAYLLTPEYITKMPKNASMPLPPPMIGAPASRWRCKTSKRARANTRRRPKRRNDAGRLQPLHRNAQTSCARAQKGRVPDLDAPLGVTTDIKLHSPALLPDGYCPDIHERRCSMPLPATCETEQQINAVHEELVDRFGLPEQPVKTLLESQRLRLAAKELGIAAIDATAEAATFTFGKGHSIDPAEIILLMQTNKNYRLAGPDKLRVNAVMKMWKHAFKR